MGELERGERLQIMLTLEELEALDNWRFCPAACPAAPHRCENS